MAVMANSHPKKTRRVNIIVSGSYKMISSLY